MKTVYVSKLIIVTSFAVTMLQTSGEVWNPLNGTEKKTDDTVPALSFTKATSNSAFSEIDEALDESALSRDVDRSAPKGGQVEFSIDLDASPVQTPAEPLPISNAIVAAQLDSTPNTDLIRLTKANGRTLLNILNNTQSAFSKSGVSEEAVITLLATTGFLVILRRHLRCKENNSNQA
jgi:hypothetical protein